MSTDVDALVEFLRACLDEDEQAAHAAQRKIAERVCPPVQTEDYVVPAGRWKVVPWLFSGQVVADIPHWGKVEIATIANDHIARWDPSRVLAEVEAKRLLLRLHRECDASCYILKVLALPYADRDGFREDWRP